MPKKIIAVGFCLASDDVKFEEFTSRASLLDWDIVLFRPDTSSFQTSERYKGKPSLNESRSFQLREASEHWRREIKQAVDSGKTVIVFLPSLEEMYIDTGERQYSGTGRNRVTTQLVSLHSNYECLPTALKPMNAKGSSMKLAGKAGEPLAQYWTAFGPVSEYKVFLTAQELVPALVTKAGDKAVGVVLYSKSSSGALVCVPDIDFSPDEFYREAGPDDEEEEGDILWTEEAEKFSAKLISTVVSLDDSLHKGTDLTPEPDWATRDAYVLDVEVVLRGKLLEAEQKLEEAQRSKEAVTEQLADAGKMRALLYEKGKPLERAIIAALQVLGFSANAFKEGESEFDVVFECAEGRLIGEAEGKDGKAVNVDKLRQLAMNLHEDLQRDEVSVPAKGVLFGNGFRLSPVEDRGTGFTEKCISAACASNTALVHTADLFLSIRYLLNQPDEKFAKRCRDCLVKGVGLVTMPEPLISEVVGSAEKKEASNTHPA